MGVWGCWQGGLGFQWRGGGAFGGGRSERRVEKRGRRGSEVDLLGGGLGRVEGGWGLGVRWGGDGAEGGEVEGGVEGGNGGLCGLEIRVGGMSGCLGWRWGGVLSE